MRLFKSDNLIGKMHELSGRVRSALIYDKSTTCVFSSAEEALVAGKGVCQDYAHVFICVARNLGVPSRYVSGYLLDTKKNTQEAMHGWAEIYVDDLGWVGFDPVHGISPDDRYIRIASGRDYEDISPTNGLLFSSQEEKMSVALSVSRQ